MRHLKLTTSILFAFILTACPQAARAAIALQDGSTAIFYTNKSVISVPFTATAGASVMVVTLMNKGGSGAGVEPKTLAWNGQTLVQAVTVDNSAGTWRDITVYYLYNPAPGTDNISGVANNNGTASDVWVQAYTLSGVDVQVPPITGSNKQNGVTSIAVTVAGVPVDSWAAVGAEHSNNTGAQGATIAVTDSQGLPSGTLFTVYDNHAATMDVLGYVAHLTAGDNTFTFTETGSSGNKESIAVAIFSPPGPPRIAAQPMPLQLYPGTTARFSVTCYGLSPTYKWFKGATPLTDGPTGSGSTITGSTSTNLAISNIAAADAGSYSVQITDSRGTTASSAAALTVVTPSEPYETAVIAAKPAIFYQLNETTDPFSGTATAFDNAGGYNGTYGTAAQNGFNGIAGPMATTGFPGFAAANKAAQFTTMTRSSNVRLPAWNLNTNTMTITAWVNPATGQALNTGIVFCRGGTTVAGLNYGSVSNPYDNTGALGYNWDNEWETYSWYSGLVPPVGQWSFVALVVTPTNATIHLINANGLASATHDYAHVPQAFDAATLIGDDSNSTSGARVFNSAIDDVAVFGSALSKTDLLALYTAASGAPANFAPIVGRQPIGQTVFAGQTVQFVASGGGSDPLTFQWQTSATGLEPFSNLSDGGRISGSGSPVLTIANVKDTDALYYRLKISNSLGSTNSDAVALTVYFTLPPENITSSAFLPAGADWDTTTIPVWSDGLAASVSAVEKPGSTYELLPGARMRSPQNPRTATFPGNILTISGSGIWTNNPSTNNSGVAELRFKQPNPGTVIFNQLVMNGGQLDAGNDGIVVLAGRVDIVKNTPFYNDGGNDRGFQVDAWLTGTADIEYHGYNLSAFMPNYVNNLNITGTSNTFSGRWNVVIGTLLGTGAGALGTNSITVGTNAAFQTTYDVNSPGATLTLNGRMYLTQNDTFKTVFVGGAPLAVGTYTFAQLNAAYPAYFPASWTPQTGAAGATAGSGSLVVLYQPAPSIAVQPVSVSKYPTETAQFSVVAQGTPPLYYQWRKGGVKLTDGANLFGANTPTVTMTNIAPGDAGSYDVVVTNTLGSATSTAAVLTVLPTGPALTLTLDFGGLPIIEPAGNDWDSVNSWSDGKPASGSVLSNPGSTYSVVAGSRLRTPAGAAYATFPGEVLTVEGDGAFMNNGTPTIGEIRFKQADVSGTVYFKRLVMNGGQLDSGQNGLVVIAGRMDVLANTPIYVDSAAGTDRAYQIDAWLTGNGTIEFHQFSAGLTGSSLNITCPTNTFTGAWNIVQGALVGSGLNSLGTNNITVGATGALETTYDIVSPQAALVLDGQMFLHQNDWFHTVTVAGVALTNGTYTFTQLNTLYPLNFPATWTRQNGSTVTAGSGSLSVGLTPPPQVTISFKSSTSGGFDLTWSEGTLLEATDLTGPWVTNLTGSPFHVSPTEARKFYRVQVR